MSPIDPSRRRDSASPKSTRVAAGRQWRADLADPRSRRHARDVGDGEQLRWRAVEAGAGRPDPDRDGHRRVGDVLEQLLHRVAPDHGAATVDLEDQRLRAVLVGAADGVADLGDEDLVHQPAHLLHVDGRDVSGAWPTVVGRPSRRPAPAPVTRARRGTPRRPAGRGLVCAKVPPERDDAVPLLTASRVVVVAGKGVSARPR
ncbi:MAG: hypothetical protein WKF58_06870 [Ilumatobacteraceae bacterium]